MEDEFKKLLELQAQSETYADELQKIREAKLVEIRKILDWFFLVVRTYISLRKNKDEIIPFNDLLQKIRCEFSQDDEDRPFIETSGFIEYIKEPYTMAIDKMVKLEFEPTKNMTNLSYLWVLWKYYNTTINIPPTLVDMRLDLSLYKLMRACYVMALDFEHKGSRELTRIKKSSAKLRTKSDTKKAYVSEIYHMRKEIRSGLKLNTVAKIIKMIYRRLQINGTELEKSGKIVTNMKCPSLDQIKRYLDKDGILERDFKKKGRYIILQR